MRILLTLIRKDLALFLRDKAALSLTFLIPIALIYIFGQVFGINRTSPGPSGIPLAVVNASQSHTPLPELIGKLNRHLRGWANYFSLGYPRPSFRNLNHFVRHRLHQHLQRRSQRGWRGRTGISLYAHLQHLGLRAL